MRKDWLYPKSKPFHEGEIKTADGKYTIPYKEYGNPNGIPIVYLHGGPGAGTPPYCHRFFDPEAFHVITYDQRGAGKSKPYAGIDDNDPDLLVADLDLLREHLGFDQWHVTGGSWGSTLLFRYAETHPDRTLSMTGRGMFGMRGKELEAFYAPNGAAAAMFPGEYEKLINFLPPEERHDPLTAYFNRLSSDDESISLPAARVWSHFEDATCHLIPSADKTPRKGAKVETDPAKIAAKELKSARDNLAIARIETAFFMRHRFEPDDVLIRDIEKIRHIPCHLVQGHYDVVCPPMTAYDVKKAFPEMTLEVVLAGHSASEPEITKALVRSFNRIRDTGSPVPAPLPDGRPSFKSLTL